MRLNMEDWKEFYVENIFRIEPTKGKNSTELLEGNDISYIAAKYDDNGLAMRCQLEGFKDWVSEGNCIVFIQLGAGSAGYANYIPSDFIGMSGKTACGYIDGIMTPSIGLFLSTLLCKERDKYSFGRSWTGNRLKETILKLPICRDENNEPIIDATKKYSEEGYIPDFEWMENYIKTLNHKPLTTSNGGGRGKNKLQLDVERWGEFEVVKLFNGYKRGTRITTSDRLSGNYPFVTAGEQNEGVAEKINNIEAITYNNAITIDMFGNSFYHGYDFKADDNILVLKNKTFLNKYIGCFISTVINQDKYKNSYGRQYRQKDCDIHVIKLPICYGEDGETPVIDTTHKYSKEGYIPDFKFMEEYIKSLPYGDRL